MLLKRLSYTHLLDMHIYYIYLKNDTVNMKLGAHASPNLGSGRDLITLHAVIDF